MRFPEEIIEMIIDNVKFNDLYDVLKCMNKIIVSYVIQRMWSNFFVEFYSVLEVNEHEKAKQIIEGVVHILFGSLSDASQEIVLKYLEIENDKLMKKPAINYLKFIQHVDSPSILKLCDAFIDTLNVYTVSNELFVKVISEASRFEQLTIDLVGLNDRFQSLILDITKQRRLKILHISSFLDIEFGEIVFKTNRELICELIAKCNIDMLWIEESLKIQTNATITKLKVNDRCKDLIQYFTSLELLILDKVKYDEEFLLGLKVPRLVVYTKTELDKFYSTIMKTKHIKSFRIERMSDYYFIKSFLYFETTFDVFDKLLLQFSKRVYI